MQSQESRSIAAGSIASCKPASLGKLGDVLYHPELLSQEGKGRDFSVEPFAPNSSKRSPHLVYGNTAAEENARSGVEALGVEK